MQDIAISLRNVNKKFGSVHAVRDLSFDIPRGGLLGFLGPNGAGKSTTIRMIMSIIYPDSGNIRCARRKCGSALDQEGRIGYLPEERGLYRKMRVVEFLKYIGRLKGMDRRDAFAAADDLADTDGSRRRGSQAMPGTLQGHAAEGPVHRRHHP